MLSRPQRSWGQLYQQSMMNEQSKQQSTFHPPNNHKTLHEHLLWPSSSGTKGELGSWGAPCKGYTGEPRGPRGEEPGTSSKNTVGIS